MYLKHFGLQEFPFTLTPNLKFFCRLRHHEDILAMTMINLSNGDGLIKIIGDVGTGKTLLCRELLAHRCTEDHYKAIYISSMPLSMSDTQKMVAYELGIQLQGGTECYELPMLIRNIVISLAAQGKRTVLIIDDAHTLSNQAFEAIRQLSNLETQSRKLLSIILVGQPELDVRLREVGLKQLAQRIVSSYHLRPLQSRNELKEYLAFRLASAGGKFHTDIFSQHALKALMRASSGVPRVINIICHKALLFAYGENKSVIDTRLLKMAINDGVDTRSLFSLAHLKKIITASLCSVALVVGGYFIWV